jgi:RimJ/RimL family protein N-acetyltransferase
MIYAQTERLIIRRRTRADLPRTVDFLNDWDVTRWLSVVPFPYAMKDAEDYFTATEPTYESGEPQLHAIADAKTDEIMGVVGLHPPRVPDPPKEVVEIGYWLGKPYWGQGIMGEAAEIVLGLAFKRPWIARVIGRTDPENMASQGVMKKIGMKYLGISPRVEKDLRGGPNCTRWEMARAAFEARERAAR